MKGSISLAIFSKGYDSRCFIIDIFLIHNQEGGDRLIHKYIQ